MEVKCLEVRDSGTFIPVIAIRPVAANKAQEYLLRRAGYNAGADESCVILLPASCRGPGPATYDIYDWDDRTYKNAHHFITKHWSELADGDVVDVEYILGETSEPKRSEQMKFLYGVP